MQLFLALLARQTIYIIRCSQCHACSCCLHSIQPVREISQGYPRGSRQLLGPFNSAFGPKDTAGNLKSSAVPDRLL
jgi:hypothetical protein